MKRTHLYIATALISATMMTGMAQARQGEDMPVRGERPAKMMHKEQANIPGMSEATQKLLQDTKLKNREAHKALYEDMKKKKEEEKALLKATPFDKAAYMAKRAETAALMERMRLERDRSMADVIEKMTPQERAAWAEHSKRGPHKGMKRGPNAKSMSEPVQE